MKKMSLSAVSVIACACFIFACGKSVYSPVSKNDSTEAVRQDAIVALDNGNYSRASEKLASLWGNDKSNSIAQLYGIALLGEGGFDLFEIMRNALALVSGTSSGGTDIMNQMTDNSNAIFGGTITPERQAYAKRAFDVLGEAANPADSGIHFQRCLTASIYSVPILQAVASLEVKLKEIETATAALGGSGAYCSVATGSAINALGQSLTEVVATAGLVAQEIKPVSESLDQCLGSSGSSASKIVSQIQGIVTKADKGCSFDAALPLSLGKVTLPVCLGQYLASASAGAVAGDGKISGCELLLHCSGGACF